MASISKIIKNSHFKKILEKVEKTVLKLIPKDHNFPQLSSSNSSPSSSFFVFLFSPLLLQYSIKLQSRYAHEGCT